MRWLTISASTQNRSQFLYLCFTDLFVYFPCTIQRAENPISASATALLNGKLLPVRKVFARLIYNGSLKSPHLSANHFQAKWRVPKFKLFVSGQFRLFLDSMDTVRTVSILSRWFQYCLMNGFNTVRTVSILSRRFQCWPDCFNTV